MVLMGSFALGDIRLSLCALSAHHFQMNLFELLMIQIADEAIMIIFANTTMHVASSNLSA